LETNLLLIIIDLFRNVPKIRGFGVLVVIIVVVVSITSIVFVVFSPLKAGAALIPNLLLHKSEFGEKTEDHGRK